MRYNIIWIFLEIVIHFCIYYFKLQDTLLGKILFPYRYLFIVILSMMFYMFFKQKDIDRLIKIVFFANLFYLFVSIFLLYLFNNI